MAFSEEKPLTVYKGDPDGPPSENETQAFHRDPILNQDHCCQRQIPDGQAQDMSPMQIQALLRTAEAPPPSPRKKPAGRSSGRR